MEIHIDDADEEVAQAIATAIAEHLGTTVELRSRDGRELANAGEDWDEEGERRHRPRGGIPRGDRGHPLGWATTGAREDRGPR